MESLIAELRRRRDSRDLLAWGVVAFAILQVIEPSYLWRKAIDGALARRR